MPSASKALAFARISYMLSSSVATHSYISSCIVNTVHIMQWKHCISSVHWVHSSVSFCSYSLISLSLFSSIFSSLLMIICTICSTMRNLHFCPHLHLEWKKLSGIMSFATSWILQAHITTKSTQTSNTWEKGQLSSGRDFSGDPGILAPRKSLKLTGNPCWNSLNLHFNENCCLICLLIRINSC